MPGAHQTGASFLLFHLSGQYTGRGHRLRDRSRAPGGVLKRKRQSISSCLIVARLNTAPRPNLSVKQDSASDGTVHPQDRDERRWQHRFRPIARADREFLWAALGLHHVQREVGIPIPRMSAQHVLILDGIFVRKRKDFQFHWMFICFAVSIVACGTTYLMEAWLIWHPAYWMHGPLHSGRIKQRSSIRCGRFRDRTDERNARAAGPT